MKAIRLASRAQPSNPPPFLPVSRCAKELKADAQDFIGLGAAAPDFDTPDHIKEAAITAIRSGFSKLSMSSGEVATSTIRRTN